MATKGCIYPATPIGLPPVLQIPALLDPIAQPLPEEPLPEIPQWALPFDLPDFSLDSNANNFWLAVLTRACYSTNANFFTEAAYAVVPSGSTITFVPASSAIAPAYGIINMPNMAIVTIGGTTNLGQWLDQIFLGTLTPTNFFAGDNAKALSTYIAAAATIDTAIVAAAGLTKPVLLAGHSMGGSVAQVLYYKYTSTTPGRSAKVISFGAPKAGERFFSAGSRWNIPNAVRIMAAGDTVPGLPPIVAQVLKAFILTNPLAAAFSWGFYAPCGDLATINAQGATAFNGEPFSVADILAAFGQALLGQPITFTSAHTMKTMCANIRASFTGYPDTSDSGWRNPDGVDETNAAMNAANLF